MYVPAPGCTVRELPILSPGATLLPAFILSLGIASVAIAIVCSVFMTDRLVIGVWRLTSVCLLHFKPLSVRQSAVVVQNSKVIMIFMLIFPS
jgi:hypothetical protein